MNDQLSKQPSSDFQTARGPLPNLDGMSLGARRVRESFNPSADSTVDKIKRYTADLIDLVEELRNLHGGVLNTEQQRLVSLAQTHYEDAAMWAVKAATTSKP
jgi:hypothetical protein